jgi:YVTN family beta-propeller protein
MRSVWIMTGAAVALALLAQEASAFTAYVSNEKGNTVTVIDLDKMEATATIEVGERPRGITMSKDG